MKILKKIFRVVDKYFSPKIVGLFAGKKLLTYFKKKNSASNFIFVPTIDWNYPLKQRPQHLAEALSNRSVSVTYCTSNYEQDYYLHLTKVNNNLYIYNNFRLAAHKLPRNSLYLISSQSFLSINQIAHYKKNGYFIIYDYVDEISDLVNHSNYHEISDKHSKILTNKYADLVTCVSKKLYEEALLYYPKDRVLYLPNAVDRNIFSLSVRNSTVLPNDIEEIIKRGKKVIGYYGAIANWLDFDLLNRYMMNHNEYSFVFIGIDYNNALKNLATNLPNVHYLGEKKYSDLPRYSYYFDIAIIPFKKGAIAKATSPLKVYEYLSMEKAVVATEDLLECHSMPGVFISKNDEYSFDRAVNKALRAYKNASFMKLVKRSVRDNDWDKRAEQLVERISLLKKCID